MCRESNTQPLTIIAIRHGCSVANEWMTGDNAWFSPKFCDDIKLKDAPLSQRGIRQATEELPPRLKCALEKEKEDNLVVLVSPLTRCLQTWNHGVRPLVPPGTPTFVAPLIRERVFSASDTGRPKQLLQEEFSMGELDWSYMAPDDNWWYCATEGAEWRPHQAQQYYAVPGEPEDVFDARLVDAKEWIQREFPGKTIILVAHWGVINRLTEENLCNCGVHRWTISPSRE